jgi:uncharacterized membrane protein
MSSPGRIRAFDWLKGIAVLVMIQTHTVALLQAGLRGSPLHLRLQRLDGLVAPSFILSSGFALALVQVRGAAAGPEERRRRARRSWRRIGEVLGVASLLTWCWFDVFLEPAWLLRVDILQCIGLSLAAAMLLFVPLARRPRLLSAVSAAVGLAILIATPLAWTVREGLAARFLSDARGSLFPLFPWSGYVFLGGALGAVAASGKVRPLLLGTLGLGALGGALSLGATRIIPRWPQLQAWLTGNHGQRVLVLSCLVLALLAVERWLPASLRRGRVAGFLELFGTSSLAAYFGHEVMIFKRFSGVSLETFCDHRAGWTAYWLLTALIIALTWGYTWLVAWLHDRVTLWPPRLERRAAAQPAEAGGAR